MSFLIDGLAVLTDNPTPKATFTMPVKKGTVLSFSGGGYDWMRQCYVYGIKY